MSKKSLVELLPLLLLLWLGCCCCLAQEAEAEAEDTVPTIKSLFNNATDANIADYILRRLRVPDISDAWREELGLVGVDLPTSPTALLKPSAARFWRHALVGRPLLLKQAWESNKAIGMSCKDIASTFGEEMAGVIDDAGVHAADADIRLEDTRAWCEDRGEGSRFNWYWKPVDPTVPLNEDTPVMRNVVNMFPLPEFLDNSDINAATVQSNIAFWFGSPGSSQSAHMDDVCDNTLIVQLSGETTVTLTLPPNIKEAVALNGALGSDYVYAWGDEEPWMQAAIRDKPVWQFRMVPGDVLYVPPGLVRASHVPLDSTVSVRAAVQFADPAPLFWLSNNTDALSNGYPVASCWSAWWNVWRHAVPFPNTNGTEEEFDGWTEDLFGRMDGNEDGQIDFNEAAYWMQLFVPLGSVDESVYQAKQFVLINDIDGSGKVSLEEYKEIASAYGPRQKFATEAHVDPEFIASKRDPELARSLMYVVEGEEENAEQSDEEILLAAAILAQVEESLMNSTYDYVDEEGNPVEAGSDVDWLKEAEEAAGENAEEFLQQFIDEYDQGSASEEVEVSAGDEESVQFGSAT